MSKIRLAESLEDVCSQQRPHSGNLTKRLDFERRRKRLTILRMASKTAARCFGVLCTYALCTIGCGAHAPATDASQPSQAEPPRRNAGAQQAPRSVEPPGQESVAPEPRSTTSSGPPGPMASRSTSSTPSPPRAPFPESVGGFTFGASVDDARRFCEGAQGQFTPGKAGPEERDCSKAPVDPFGRGTKVQLAFCDGAVCVIRLLVEHATEQSVQRLFCVSRKVWPRGRRA